MTSNNALVPDPDKFDVLASTPSQWPWLNVGLRMCGWADTQTKYYLIGNPVIWWGTTASLIIFLVVLGIYILRAHRRYADMDPGGWILLPQLCYSIPYIGLISRGMAAVLAPRKSSALWVVFTLL